MEERWVERKTGRVGSRGWGRESMYTPCLLGRGLRGEGGVAWSKALQWNLRPVFVCFCFFSFSLKLSSVAVDTETREVAWAVCLFICLSAVNPSSRTTLHTFVSIPELFCCTCRRREEPSSGNAHTHTQAQLSAHQTKHTNQIKMEAL